MTTPIEQMSFIPGRLAASGVVADPTTTKIGLSDWAANVVCVKDYGAKGDGSTDDTLAVQAAFNTAFGMAQFTATVGSGGSDNVLTVASSPAVAGTLKVGMGIVFPASLGVTRIASLGTGTGGAGTYVLDQHIGPIGSTAMMASTAQGGHIARKVYIPSGVYMISSPLYIIGMLGAHVYGAGNGSTQLYYTGVGTERNKLSTAGYAANGRWTAVLCLDGVAYSKFEMFDVTTSPTNATQGNPTAPLDTVTPGTPNMTGILAYQSATAGTTSAILFENINIENMWCGLVGVQGGGNVENCILKNVGFNGCGMYGMKLTGQNVLNWQVYGGGASSCGWLSTIVPGVGGAPENYGGGYAVGSGSCGCFYGLSCTANQWDVIHTGQQCHVAGGSFEGQQNYNGNLTWSSGTATLATDVPHKMTFTQGIAIFAAIDNNGAGVNVPGWEGRFTGTIVDATHISYPLAASPGGTGIIRAGVSSLNAGNFACVGTTMSISGCSYRCGDSLRGLWVYNEGGMVVMDGCLMDPGHNSGNKGSIIAHVSNGYLQMNGSIFSHLEDSSFKSAGVSELFLRQTQWIGAPTTVNSPFTQFSGGRIREYDRVYETTVGNLPTASAIFTSLRGFVTDANATTFGTTVAAGGSNKVPVFCDGTNWKIG